MLCEILEMRDSSGDTATGVTYTGNCRMGDWLFLPPSSLCYRHFRVLGSIGCAQTVFARGTFKASFLSTYLLFDVANFQAFLFRTSLTSIKSLRRRRGTLMYFHYFSFQISRFVLSTEIVCSGRGDRQSLILRLQRSSAYRFFLCFIASTSGTISDSQSVGLRFFINPVLIIITTKRKGGGLVI